MTRRREALLAGASMLVGFALFLVLAEVALRFLPVASGLRTLPVTADQPVMHFAPDRPFVFSSGWDFAMVNRGRVNNAGFVNDQDYRRDDPRPLVAVIGDSYVEAAMVPFAETMHGRLAKALAPQSRVYSFGASGAPLSQYLVWARHAVQAYGAIALAINVVGNDFDESHVAYGTGPGFWRYAPRSDGSLALVLFEYRPGLLHRLAQHSALARYLAFNLHAGPQMLERAVGMLVGSAKAAAPDQAQGFAGNTSADSSPARLAASEAAIAAFLRDLPAMTGLPPGRVVFTIDGFRNPAAAEQGAGSYFDRMRRAFIAKAGEAGFETIDLDPFFFARYARTHEAFNYPRDGHWNAAGHDVAAQALLGSQTLARLQP
ncbi:MAG: hypothetical protein IT563_19090 [Alphaproteobacteria bacterium]|nr:hypothetical protein [Alphaproteobacteria bacterium]